MSLLRNRTGQPLRLTVYRPMPDGVSMPLAGAHPTVRSRPPEEIHHHELPADGCYS